MRTLACDLLIHSAGQLLTLAGGPQRGHRLGQLGLVARRRRGHHRWPRGGRRQHGRPAPQVQAAPDPARRRPRGAAGLCGPAHPRGLGRRPRQRVRAAAGRHRATWRSWRPAAASCPPCGRRAPPAWASSCARRARACSRMLAHGTTTVEAKTGYGLDTGQRAAHAGRHRAAGGRRARGPWCRPLSAPTPCRPSTPAAPTPMWTWWWTRCCRPCATGGRRRARRRCATCRSSATSSARRAPLRSSSRAASWSGPGSWALA